MRNFFNTNLRKIWDGESEIEVGDWLQVNAPVLYCTEDQYRHEYFPAVCCGKNIKQVPIFEMFENTLAAPEYLYDSWEFGASLKVISEEEVSEVLGRYFE